MPKAGKRVYAVRHGREGPKIYHTWEEARPNVNGYSGALHRSFPISQLSKAEEYINVSVKSHVSAQKHQPICRESQFMKHGPGRTSLVQVGSSCRFSDDELPPAIQDQFHVLTPDSEPEGMELLPCDIVSDQSPAGPSQPLEPQIQLSAQQRSVIEMVKQGKNVFFTGSAGTGKSVLLREIIRVCGEDMRRKELAVTAYTGIAAVNIDGTTLHSWAGIGLGKESPENLLGKLLGQEKRRKQEERKQLPYSTNDKDGSPQAVTRWRTVRALIIDEISMMDGVLFDKLEFIARSLRMSDKPFGGIQLVLSGDFFQLPPIAEKNWSDDTTLPVCFAFDASTWGSCIQRPVFLTEVFRQKDKEFVAMLNAMRLGHLESETIKKFKALSRPVEYDDGIEPTDLFPLREDVEVCNTRRLAALKGPEQRYKSTDTPGFDEKGDRISGLKYTNVLKRMTVSEIIHLKKNAQVMLLQNQPGGLLVNGSVGRIIDFSTLQDAMKRGIQVAGHDLSQTRGGGRRENPGHPKLPEELLEDECCWPLVEFPGGKWLLCVPQVFEVHNSTGGVAGSRRQVPLNLAWASSIHKSQGQTLERVRVNLGRAFETGQAYVALSRATSMESLQVIAFDPTKVMTNPRVIEWFNEQWGATIVDDLDQQTYGQALLGMPDSQILGLDA